ncbi:hypothetical protein BSKO_01189 [Bryopsis sp. KO-2023]|nr:hypothetical protein BSKO_01189 [Bryopsis sp. KO-2023]
MLGSRLCERLACSVPSGSPKATPCKRLCLNRQRVRALDDEKVGRFSEISQQDDQKAMVFGLSPAQLLIASVSGFGLVALDVFDSHSLHLLAPIDVALHSWVTEYFSPSTSQLFGRWISDIFIVPELLLWPVLWVLMLRKDFFEGGAVLSLSCMAYAMGGPILHGDTALVNALKVAFQRARPGGIHRTFAFPSGHTTAAMLLTGTILFVFLPVLFDALPQMQGKVVETEKKEVGPSKMDVVGKYAPVIWGLAYFTTAAGRVGADAHWLSDTLAGFFLGIGLVASLRIGVEEVIKAKNIENSS